MTIELPRPLRRPGITIMEHLRRTDARALLPGLLANQWSSPEELRRQQAAALDALGHYCGTEVPWYEDAFARAGLAGSPLTPESLVRLPLMRKGDVRQAGEALKSRSFAAWQPRRKSTSGSTGMPLNYYLDRPSHSHQWAHLWRGWDQVGYKPGDIYATLSGGSLVPEKVDLKQKIYLVLSGAIHLPSYHLSETVMAGYRRTLEARKVRFLYGYPSSLELFARFLLESGGRPLGMAAVFTTSENLTTAARGTIESAFGCRVIDTYGCNDGGLYSFECDRHDGFHIGTESVFVEITDDEGNRLADGEIGNVVTTNLVMRAMPLLRYVTGDLGAVTHAACACGRGLQRIVKLQGRDRDFVLTPAGRKVHGAFFNHFAPFYESSWLQRFQVHQPDRDTIILRLVVSRRPVDSELDHLKGELRRGLGDMDIRVEFVEDLMLTRTGKFRVITSDLSAPGQP